MKANVTYTNAVLTENIKSVAELDKNGNNGINQHRDVWHTDYIKIRTLNTIVGMKVRKYIDDKNICTKGQVRYQLGEWKINQTFWAQIKPAQRSYITKLMNECNRLIAGLIDAEELLKLI